MTAEQACAEFGCHTVVVKFTMHPVCNSTHIYKVTTQQLILPGAPTSWYDTISYYAL